MSLYNRNKCNFIISATSLFFIPLLGLLCSLASLDNRSSNKGHYILISLFFFFVFLNIPPLSDLFRHYASFNEYYAPQGLSSLLEGKLDLTLPISMYFLQKTDIPFYSLPALYVSISIYLILKTTGKVITSSGISISRNAFIAIHFISITMAPLFIIALGLRFGLACFISIYASTLYSIGEMKTRKFILLSIISVLTHFSVVAIILSTILSKVIKLKKSHVIIFGISAFFLSGILLPLVVSGITLLNINVYAQAYLSGAFGSFENKNLNGIINYTLQFIPFIIFLTYYLRCSHQINKTGIYNLCSMSIIMLAFSSIAPVAAGRFVLPVTYFLFFNYIYSKRG